MSTISLSMTIGIRTQDLADPDQYQFFTSASEYPDTADSDAKYRMPFQSDARSRKPCAKSPNAFTHLDMNPSQDHSNASQDRFLLYWFLHGTDQDACTILYSHSCPQQPDLYKPGCIWQYPCSLSIPIRSKLTHTTAPMRSSSFEDPI